MAKPFKNLSSPSSNTNESPKSPIIDKEWPTVEDRTKNGERVNDGLEQDGEKPIVFTPVDNGTKPMRIKNNGG